MTQRTRAPGQRAAEALVLMTHWFPAALNTTASFATQTGAIEIQLHDSMSAKVELGDGYRLAGWLFGKESYDFHDVSCPGPARHHHWQGTYDGLAVTIAWVENRTPEGLFA